MAFEPKTWACGDTITAQELNRMEQGIAEAGQGGDVGYECTEVKTILFDGSLTTNSSGGAPFSMAQFTPTSQIDANSITVTIDGTEYELPKVTASFGTVYGEINGNTPLFTNYPCAIVFSNNTYFFCTPSDGTHQVNIASLEEDIITTECFEKAVKSMGGGLKYIKDDSSDNGGVIENLVGNDIPSASRNQATGAFSHAEGGGIESEYGQTVYRHTIASGMGSHAEGRETTASGDYSHAEGCMTTASEHYSHAEGDGSIASGRGSHAEGLYTVASGDYSHAEGMYTEASGQGQHVLGKFNIISNNFAEIVGNGVNGEDENRSNARTLDWNGNEWLAGSLTLGSTRLTEAQLQALLALLNS